MCKLIYVRSNDFVNHLKNIPDFSWFFLLPKSSFCKKCSDHTYLVDLSEERQQVQDSQANFCGYIGLSVYMVDNVYFIGVAYKMQNKTVHQHISQFSVLSRIFSSIAVFTGTLMNNS